MSERERNERLLRAGIEAYNRGDVDGVLAILADDVECFISAKLVNSGSYVGHEGVLRMLDAWNDAWQSIAVTVAGVEEVDPEHLLAEVRQRAIGAGSGVPVELTVYWLFEFRDDLVRRLLMHADRESALEAARA
jgi:ketosteroid isomerase-like protein